MAPQYPQETSTMNSLKQLNTYSQIPVLFDDDRAPTIIFSNTLPVSSNITVIEGVPFTSISGTDITTLHGYYPVNLTINTSAFSSANITWVDPLPSIVTTSNPSTGIYIASNILTPRVWDTIKNFTITPVRDSNSSGYITSTITWPTGDSKTWVTTVNLTATDELSPTISMYFDKNETKKIVGITQIIDTDIDGTYNMNVSSNVGNSITSLSSYSYLGGNSTYYSSSTTLQLVGNRAQVNNHLSNITLDSAEFYQNNSSLTYTLTNPVSNLVTIVGQNLILGNIYPDMTNIRNTRYYNENTVGRLYSNLVPQLTSVTGGNPTFTVNISLSSNVGFISTGNRAARTPNWFYSNRSYVYSGTKANVNILMGNLYFFPHPDTSTTTTLQLNQYEGSAYRGTDVVSLIGAANPTAFSTGGSLAAGVYTYNALGAKPYLGDLPFYANGNLDPRVPVSTNLSNWAADPWKQPSGVYAGWTQGNSSITLNVSNNNLPATFTYGSYQKNNYKFRAGDVIQLGANANAYTVSTHVAYNSNTVNLTTNITESTTANAKINLGYDVIKTDIHTLNLSQLYYCTMDLLVVAGGGGGGGSTSSSYIPGSGGAGGLLYYTDLALQPWIDGTAGNVTVQMTNGFGGAPGIEPQNFGRQDALWRYGNGASGNHGGNTRVIISNSSVSTTYQTYGGGGGLPGGLNAPVALAEATNGGSGGSTQASTTYAGGARAGVGVIGQGSNGAVGGGSLTSGAGGSGGAGSAGGRNQRGTGVGVGWAGSSEFAAGAVASQGGGYQAVNSPGSGGAGESTGQLATAYYGQAGATFIRLKKA